MAALWPRPLVPDNLKCAARVVRWLQDQGLTVRSVERWSHLPFNKVSCAVTMSTNVGWVKAVVFSDASRALERFRVVETPPTASRSERYEYRVSDWPDPSEQPAWESSYRWFFTVRHNWVLVTTDVGLNF
jgi:hypothetical protein